MPPGNSRLIFQVLQLIDENNSKTNLRRNNEDKFFGV